MVRFVGQDTRAKTWLLNISSRQKREEDTSKRYNDGIWHIILFIYSWYF